VLKGQKPTAEQIKAVREQWIETGSVPDGWRIKSVQWKNPARKDPMKRSWRFATTESQIEEARQTLRFFRTAKFRTVRFTRRTGKT